LGKANESVQTKVGESRCDMLDARKKLRKTILLKYVHVLSFVFLTAVPI
jgi:hypothetical protein